MTNLSSSICLLMAEARRKKGLTQSALAREVGCRQNALSMFEAGNPTKLSEDIVKKLSEKLNVPLESIKEEAIITSSPVVHIGTLVHGFCPNCSCPSNLPYLVGGRLFFKPNRIMCSPDGGKFCAMCGEVLEKSCPNCGGALNEGSCCTKCGNQYIVNTLPEDINLTAWINDRISLIRAF